MEDLERIEARSLQRKHHPRERFNKDLTEDDLYQPLKEHDANILGAKLEKVWDEELKNGRRKPSLLRALVKIFGKEVAFLGIIVVFEELIVKMAQPYVLGKFLSYYVPKQISVSINEAYSYAFMIVFTTFIDLLIFNVNVLNLMHMGMKVRVACCSLIYRKALKLSKSALAETTVGQMVNLLSNDVSRLEGVFLHLHHVWIGPIAAVVIVYFLYTTVHPAALVGLLVFLLFIPLQLFLVKKLSTFRRKIALKTDYRIKLVNEIVSGIQVIKMYTWEIPFTKLIAIARKLELNEIKGASYIRALNRSFMNYLSKAAIYFCVLLYVLSGNQLQAQYVFVTILYYNILKQLLIDWFPRGISTLAEAYVSVGRIEEFLNYDELEANQEKKIIDSFDNDDLLESRTFSRVELNQFRLNFGINIEDVSVKWISCLDYTLKKIHFSATFNELIAIVGPVGSGKSTLFYVILKELPLANGNLDVGGSISYASQEPWLFSGSIRQNILFGEKMNEKKYGEVIRVCDLERDFSLFPFGDRSLIGERGIMLSGGQKARINLARAIYRDADIYLLDDPLSAVDTHVGKHLFEECISGYLKNKCVVLITHQLQYLRTVDKIYLLENGSITTSGNYLQLQSNIKEKFIRLLQNQPSSMTDDENVEPLTKEKVIKKSKLPTDVKEQRSTGKVARKVYKNYITAGGNLCVFIFVVFLFILAQLLSTGIDYFLTFWVNVEQERLENTLANESILLNETATTTTKYMNKFLTSQNCIIIYTVILLLLIISSLYRSISIFKFCLNASKNLHNMMFSKLIITPLRFFHTNPSGRILNRFSRDLGIIDESLSSAIIDTIHVGLTVLSIIIVVAIVNPWILLPTIIIFGLFYVYKIIFLATSRDLKRLESTARSPVYSHLTASVQGLTTIRASNAETILLSEFHNHQNLHTSAQYMYKACSRTFGFYLDFTCIIYIAFVTFSFLIMRIETYGGNVGLAITQSISLTRMLQWGMRQWRDLENQMTSVERIVEYTEMPPELDNGVQKPPNDWPNNGSIEFCNVSLRYSLDGAQVLNDINFKIKGKEKIGIVGRTGAGKSSLISALFRLAEIEGSIIIDDFNIKQIPLKELRSKISIIPQDPVLFSGTLRKNLDPFEEFEDGILWNALEEVQLKNVISDMPTGLQCNVSESGTNFSCGQKQLLCLARAIIRNNKVLILDEATANVDPQTDELIQATIRKKFIDCTILTIAHRLHTVMDCDKILVMDGGFVAEFDHPYRLLLNHNGIFYSLVKQTGRAMSENLTKIAEENYVSRRNTSSL